MIYVMLADGFEEIEALAFVDILRRADINVQTVSVDNVDTARGCHGINVVVDLKMIDIHEIGDGIVLPGGLPGTYNLRDNQNVINLIKQHYDMGKIVGAICAAPSVLSGLGLLKDKNATCYPSFERHLVGATYITDKVVADGNIITSRGAGTAHDFALKFVELIKGKECSDNIRSSMLYDN